MWHSEYISITLHGSPDYFYFSPVIHPQWSSSASNRGVAPSSCHFPPSLQTSINLFMCFVCLILRAQVYFYFPTNDFTSPVPPPNSPQIGQLITVNVSHEQQTVPAIHIAMYVCNRKRDFFFFLFFFLHRMPAGTETALWFSDNEWTLHQRHLHFAGGMKKHETVLLSSELGPQRTLISWSWSTPRLLLMWTNILAI